MILDLVKRKEARSWTTMTSIMYSISKNRKVSVGSSGLLAIEASSKGSPCVQVPTSLDRIGAGFDSDIRHISPDEAVERECRISHSPWALIQQCDPPSEASVILMYQQAWGCHFCDNSHPRHSSLVSVSWWLAGWLAGQRRSFSSSCCWIGTVCLRPGGLLWIDPYQCLGRKRDQEMYVNRVIQKLCMGKKKKRRSYVIKREIPSWWVSFQSPPHRARI